MDAKIVALGGVNEEENREVAERAEKIIDNAVAKLNKAETVIALALTSTKRTMKILVDGGNVPKQLADMLMSAMMDVALQVPEEKVSKAKVVAACLVIQKQVEELIEKVHAKHCPGCEDGEHAVKPPAAWN